MSPSIRDYVLATAAIAIAGAFLYVQPWGDASYLFAIGFGLIGAYTVFTS